MRRPRRKDELPNPIVIVQKVIAGAPGAQPNHASRMITLSVSYWFDKEFSVAHPFEFCLAG